MEMYHICCIIPIESVLLIQFCTLLIMALQWECYPECLFVILTQCYCVSASRILSQIKFEDADCFVIHTLCQVVMACCVLWVENQMKKVPETENTQ